MIEDEREQGPNMWGHLTIEFLHNITSQTNKNIFPQINWIIF